MHLYVQSGYSLYTCVLYITFRDPKSQTLMSSSPPLYTHRGRKQTENPKYSYIYMNTYIGTGET